MCPTPSSNDERWIRSWPTTKSVLAEITTEDLPRRCSTASENSPVRMASPSASTCPTSAGLHLLDVFLRTSTWPTTAPVRAMGTPDSSTRGGSIR